LILILIIFFLHVSFSFSSSYFYCRKHVDISFWLSVWLVLIVVLGWITCEHSFLLLKWGKGLIYIHYSLCLHCLRFQHSCDVVVVKYLNILGHDLLVLNVISFIIGFNLLYNLHFLLSYYRFHWLFLLLLLLLWSVLLYL
jgi:hypothetical protein